MNLLKTLFERLSSKERRKAERRLSPQLAAFFWNGGSPIEHNIRDISSTGLFLVTEERWYPGTLVVMTLQKKGEGEDNKERSISVQSRAVRWGSDGIGLEFVVPDLHDPARGHKVLADGVDGKALKQFLENLSADNGHAVIDFVARPASLLGGTDGTRKP